MAEVESSAEGKAAQHRKELLYDIYKKEAEEFVQERKFSKAVQSYSLAIKIQPKSKGALLGRSKCYLHLGKTYRAMQDAERSLTLDASDIEAVYQKAEILYLTGNYQLALVYYKRGLRLDPDNPRFEDGRQRTALALQRFGGGNVTKNKLSAVGDLSFFLNNKMHRPLPKDYDNDLNYSSVREDLPSAGFRNRDHCPLKRIIRKPRFPQLASFDTEISMDPTGETPQTALRQPDEETMRKILGELYGDRQYLQKLQSDLPRGKRARSDVRRLAQEGANFLRERSVLWDRATSVDSPLAPRLPPPPPILPTERLSFSRHSGDECERELTMLTDEGLEFLRERSIFWDSLGPLPPPVPSRKSYVRERTFASMGSESTINYDLPWRRRNMQKDKESEPPDISQVNFDFRSHLKTRQRERRGETRGQPRTQAATGNLPGLLPVNRSKPKIKRSERTMFVGFEDPEVERRRDLARFINEELDIIDEDFKAKNYEDCLHKAEVCLHAVSTLNDGDIKKAETFASLHSCIGNACIALRRFEKAFYHHQTALRIGETEKNNSIIARSLGHMGRMYIIQQKFNKALEVFARKAPMCASLEEVAQTFHEIGNCFLVLGHYDYARDCGKKSLRAARDAELPFFQQQAWILIAIAEAKMQHLDECHKAFSGALRVAKANHDEDSATAIQGAMDHINRKMDQILRTKTLVNQRMLLRAKAKELTHEDVMRRPKRKPLPTVKKQEAVPATGNQIYVQEYVERQMGDETEQGTHEDQTGNAMETDVPVQQSQIVVQQGSLGMQGDDAKEQTLVAVDQGGDVTDQDSAAREQNMIAKEGTVAGEGASNAEQRVTTNEVWHTVITEHGLQRTRLVQYGDPNNRDNESIAPTDDATGEGQQVSAADQQHLTEMQTKSGHDGDMFQNASFQKTPRNLTKKEVALLTLEKSERNRERQRFRKEAVHESINFDPSSYDMYAREKSNARRAYSRGGADAVTYDVCTREKSFQRRASRTSLDPVTVEIYTRERSNVRKPTPLERTKSKQGKRKTPRAEKKNTPRDKADQKLEQEVNNNCQTAEAVAGLHIEDTPRDDTESVAWHRTDTVDQSGYYEHTPRPGTDTTLWQNMGSVTSLGYEFTPRPLTEYTVHEDTEDTHGQSKAMNANQITEPANGTDAQSIPFNTHDKVSELKGESATLTVIDSTSQQNAACTPQENNVEPLKLPQVTQSTPRKISRKTSTPRTEQTPRLQKGRSFRQDPDGISQVELNTTPRPGTEQTPRKGLQRTPRPSTERASRRQNDGRVSNLEKRRDADGMSRMSNMDKTPRPGTEETPRGNVDKSSRPGTEQTARPGRPSRQGSRLSRLSQKDVDVSRPQTERASRMSRAGGFSRQEEIPVQTTNETPGTRDCSLMDDDSRVPDGENENGKREAGDGISDTDSYARLRLSAQRSNTRGRSKLMTSHADLKEHEDEGLLSSDAVINMSVTEPDSHKRYEYNPMSDFTAYPVDEEAVFTRENANEDIETEVMKETAVSPRQGLQPVSEGSRRGNDQDPSCTIPTESQHDRLAQGATNTGLLASTAESSTDTADQKQLKHPSSDGDAYTYRINEELNDTADDARDEESTADVAETDLERHGARTNDIAGQTAPDGGGQKSDAGDIEAYDIRPDFVKQAEVTAEQQSFSEGIVHSSKGTKQNTQETPLSPKVSQSTTESLPQHQNEQLLPGADQGSTKQGLQQYQEKFALGARDVTGGNQGQSAHGGTKGAERDHGVSREEDRKEDSSRLVHLGCGGDRGDERFSRPPTVTSLVSAC